jgi:chromate transporter
MTPAFLVIPLLCWLGRRVEHESVQRTIRAVILAAAGLLLASSIPMARDAWANALTTVVALISLLLLIRTRLDTVWIVLGAAVIGMAAHAAALLPHA